MTPIVSAVLLLTINLGLLWLLMAAPVGRRTITLHRTLEIAPERLWHAFHPGGEEASWNPSILSSGTERERGGIEIAYSHPDRHGAPIRRVFKVEENVDSAQCSYESRARVVDDTALDISFWRNFEEYRAVSAVPGGSTITLAQTDDYRGLAVYLFRYFMIRRELSSLTAWLKNGRPKTGGMIEHPVVQIVLALLSTLLLWPFFGLTAAGLTISIILTLVIVLHELGHMAAYRAFGHERVRMIFVPFLGGIAIGGRPYNSRFEVATCALMGAGMSAFLVPVVISVHDLSTAHLLSSSLREPALVFLLILGAFNLLNLLPMTQFDGGRVLRQIFPTRSLLVTGSFGITLLMLWVGYRIGLSSTALIAALAVFTLMSLMGISSAKPRESLDPMHPGERLMAGLGLYAAVAIHSHGIVYACDRLFG
ncbi:Mll1338 protein [Neorhizobium galegae bv. orientalis]|nr:Mll1338 protein [Neorhizobium galegae bv. orientalis]